VFAISGENAILHLPVFSENRRRCVVCAKKGL